MLDYFLTVGTAIEINIILALGLNIIIGYAGQPHLGIAAYSSVGAYLSALLLIHTGMPVILVLLLAITVAGLFAALTGLPSLRVNNDFLAILTIGMVFVVESLYAYLPHSWFGGPLGLTEIPAPQLLGRPLNPLSMFIVVAVIVALCILLNLMLVRSWLGLTWKSVREDVVASGVLGNDVSKAKIIAFGIGGAYCGLAGSIFAQFMGSVSPSDFGFLPSLFLLTTIMLGGVGTIRGPIVGAIILGVLPELFRFVQEYRNLVYGGLLVLVMLYQPSGLFGDNSVLWRKFTAIIGRWKRPAAQPLVPAQKVTITSGAVVPARAALEVKDLGISFGGLMALSGIDLRVEPGTILGVIGPNGAGKTSLFNIISGVLRPSRGAVYLGDRAIHELKSNQIAQLGIGRTFQIVRPFPNLSVLENVLVPYGAKHFSKLPLFFKPYMTEKNVDHARQILMSTALLEYEGQLARTLPLGLQRRLEIARTLALDAQVILLDEAFSGLSVEEAESQKRLVVDLKRQGKALILIEHDMEIAVDLCDWFVVLNFGHKIAEGLPRNVCRDPAVIEAYLGKDE